MRKIDSFKAAVAAVLLATAGLVNAQDALEISGNVALTSDYKFRGISQSDESIALQGGFDLEFGSGFYIGGWASSVDFNTNDPAPGEDDDGNVVVAAPAGADGSLELDLYAGFGGDFSESSSYDLGVLYYDYPGDDKVEGDYWELYGSVSFSDLTLGVAWSDDYYLESGSFTYAYVDYGFTLPGDFSLALHAGYNSIKASGGFLDTDEDNYWDYAISLGKELAGVEWSLAWVDTNLSKEDVFGTEWGEGAVVFTIAKSL